MVTVFPIAAWVLAIVATLIQLARGPRGLRIGLEALMTWVFVFPLGLLSLWAFMGHVFFAQQAAASIGWAPSPFQFEVGLANLGMGVGGLLAAVFRRNLGFAAATAVMAACFLGGAGVGHIIQISETGNMATGNAGPILYTDFLTPAVLLAIIALLRLLPGRA